MDHEREWQALLVEHRALVEDHEMFKRHAPVHKNVIRAHIQRLARHREALRNFIQSLARAAHQTRE